MPVNVFITGTNRGLGKQLVKILIKNPQVRLFIHSRLPPEQLHQLWQHEIGPHAMKCHQFDLKEQGKMAKTVESMREQGVRLDRIVANAGVGLDWSGKFPSVQRATDTLNVDLKYTIDFIKQFLPLLSENGRVVVVSSAAGQLAILSQPLRQMLLDSSITEEKILSLADDYIAAAYKKDLGIYHWCVYRVAKALLNCWSRFILSYTSLDSECVVMHPGWCRTDMGTEKAPLSPEEGGKLLDQTLWMKQINQDMFYNTQYVDFIQCQVGIANDVTKMFH